MLEWAASKTKQKGSIMEYTFSNVTLISDADIPEDEARAYIERGIERAEGHPERIDHIEAHVDGDDVELSYYPADGKFERIRRITGYLVGTLDRFNDAKRAEEGDRVKHAVAAR